MNEPVVYYSAPGFTREDIGDEVGVSRDTITKYRHRAREAVESADDSRETLASVIQDDHDWDRGQHESIPFEEHPI